MKKKLKVTKQSDSGRNIEFQDQNSKKKMTRAEAVKEIKKGKYPDYHVRKLNGLETPISNPDNNSKNNLG